MMKTVDKILQLKYNIMRKLATTQKIKDIQPIPNADKIEVATIHDWKVVVEKNKFNVGDFVIFYEIDSFLPVIPEYEFLLRGGNPKKMLNDGKEVEGIRLKTVRLRSQISQGLIMPLSILKNEVIPVENLDVSEELNVIKYEQPVPANMRGEIKGCFPSILPHTDEERIQNCGDILIKHKNKTLFYVTSKLDGTSCTMYKQDGVFGVCGRNWEMKDGDNIYWDIARKYNIEKILPDNYAIQGEIVGEGLQKNPLKISGQEFYIFNVICLSPFRYYSYNEFKEFVNEYGLLSVPVIDDNFKLNHSIEELIDYATRKSPLNENEMQEGIVVRPLISQSEEINGSISRFSFKVISNSYLLKHDK